MQESIDMWGRVRLCLTDRAGQVVHEQQVHNRIVKSGRRLVAQSFGGLAGGAPVTHVGVGTGTAQPSDDDTVLKAQRGYADPDHGPATCPTFTSLFPTPTPWLSARASR